jgi:hypothetical protein
MYMALMGLVEIHAQISRVAENLLERGMNALVEDIAQVALLSFKQVKRFGMGGMLCVCGVSPSSRIAIADELSPTGYAGDRVHAPIAWALRVSAGREDARGAVY